MSNPPDDDQAATESEQSDAPPPFRPDQNGVFERLIYDLVVNGDVIPEALNGTLLVGSPAGQAHRVLVVRDGANARLIIGQLAVETKRSGPMEVAVIGGSPETFATLPQRPASLFGHGLWCAHVSDTEALTCPSTAGPGKGWLRKQLEQRRTEVPDWSHFQALYDAATRQEKTRLQSFAKAMKARPVVTYSLLVMIALVFLVELAYGAERFAPAAVRMGALTVAGVQAGEVWRLASCTFLHGSIMHAVLNGYVLLAIGGSLEPLLGKRRFLVLYAGSGLAGSALSLAWLGERYSVGASGAIWGLMCAQFVIAWVGKGVLPLPLPSTLRSAAGKNLLLNLFISFVPGVDIAAHFGGGIAGALLVGTGLLAAGLPNWGDSSRPLQPHFVPPIVTGAAAVSAFLLPAGLVAALAVGQVWTLQEPIPLERRDLDGYCARVPEQIELIPTESDAIEFSGGSLLENGIMVDILLTKEPILPDAFEDVLGEMSQALAGFQEGELQGPLTINDAGVLVGTRRFDSEATVEHAVRATIGGVRRVDVLYAPNAPESWRGLASEIVLSIEP